MGWNHTMITRWVFMFLLMALLMYYASDELPYNHPFMNTETIMGGQIFFDISAKLKEDGGSITNDPWTLKWCGLPVNLLNSYILSACQPSQELNSRISQSA